MESLCPPVRELRPGERPSDWANDPLTVDDNTAPARVEPGDLPPIEEPQLYQMQFATTEEHTQLVEKAKALLSHASPKLSLGDLHLQAMRLLVEALEKKRFGAKRPRQALDAKPPRQRGRTVPSAIRRQVYDRDRGQCTFVDDRGARCPETHFIQVHHVNPFGQGGGHQLDNLTLRCAAHNALAAEQDYGSEHIALRRDGARHLSRRHAER